MRGAPRIEWLVLWCVLTGVGLRLLEAAQVWRRSVIGALVLGLTVAGSAWLLRGPDEVSREGWSRRDLAALLSVLGLSTVVRVIGVTEFPAGLFVDEEHMALAARSMGPLDLLPGHMVAMRPGWVELAAPWYGWPALLFALFGVSFTSIKLVSLIPGIVTPAALYAVVRSWGTRVEALAAGLILAGSSWHAGLSRWGWIEVASTLMLLLSFGAVMRQRLYAAAVLLALDLYLYEALRVPVLAALILLGLRLHLRGQLRRAVRPLALFVVMALPLLTVYARRPELVTVRAREVSVFRHTSPTQGVAALGRNVLRYGLMFHQSSDPNPRLHPSGEPYLDPVAGGLFLVGLAALIVGAAEGRRRYPALVLMSGTAACLAPGVLTRIADAPHGFRTGAAAPLVCAMAGVGAGLVWRRARWLYVVLLVVSMSWGTYLLWVRWPLAMGPEPPQGPGARLLAARVAARAAASGRAVRAAEPYRGATWKLLAGNPRTTGPDPVILEDPYRRWELDCEQAIVHRDPFGRPLLLEARGCEPLSPSPVIDVGVWPTAQRRGPPAVRRWVVRIDESPCLGAPCAVRFSTHLRVVAGGEYLFETWSDDGSGVSLDGRLVVDNRGESLGRRRQGQVQLHPGVHSLDVTYHFVRGHKLLRLYWRPPGGDWGPVPPDMMELTPSR